MSPRRCLPAVLAVCVLLACAAGCRKRPAPAGEAPPAALPNRTVHVLCYHNITAKPESWTDTASGDFAAQLGVLQQGGYRSISASQLASYLANERDLPDKSVLITFDDGRASFTKTARPLLERYGFRATLFVITGAVGSRGTLSWGDVRALQDAGYEIGSHTASHLNLTRPGKKQTLAQLQQQVRRELTQSAELLTSRLGRVPVALAYPYGNYDAFAMQTARESGYRLAFSIDPGAVDNQSNVWALPRQMVVDGTRLKTFERVLQTEPLHLTGIVPRIGERLPSRNLKVTAEVTDAEALTSLGVEAGKRSRLLHVGGGAQITVTGVLNHGANRVRVFSSGSPRRETGWIVVCDS